MSGVLPFLVPSSFDEWRNWLRHDAPSLLTLLVVLVAAFIVFRKVISRALQGALQRAARGRSEDPVAVERRARTFVATINWLFTIFLVFIGVSLLLDNLGMNVSALVAGVGIIGLGLGLGAQTLIKDVINGTFILIEDQYRVGDIVTVAGVSGEVVEINPRRTVLRDLDGNVHSVPNSAITIATNRTMGFSRINLDLTVPANQDLGRVRDLIDRVGDELRQQRPTDVLSAPRFVRVSGFKENGIEVKVMCDVRAGCQWELGGELRQRLLDRFAAEGIRLFAAQATPASASAPTLPVPDEQEAPREEPSS